MSIGFGELFRESMKRKTLGRILCNKLIEKHCTVKGIFVDIGSGDEGSYLRKLNSPQTIKIDLSKECRPDIIADCERGMPLKKNSVDYVISYSVLEHIYDDKQFLKNVFSILKKGGAFYFSIPFMMWVHGAPDDYRRLTKSSLERLLKETGYKNITVIPFGGYFSVLANHFGYVFYNKYGRVFLNVTFFYLDKLAKSWSKSIKKLDGLNEEKFPLGYLCIAEK